MILSKRFSLIFFSFTSLVVPFLRFGEIVTRGPHFPLTTDALRKVVTGEASRDVLISIYHAVLTFFPVGPGCSFILVWYLDFDSIYLSSTRRVDSSQLSSLGGV